MKNVSLILSSILLLAYSSLSFAIGGHQKLTFSLTGNNPDMNVCVKTIDFFAEHHCVKSDKPLTLDYSSYQIFHWRINGTTELTFDNSCDQFHFQTFYNKTAAAGVTKTKITQATTRYELSHVVVELTATTKGNTTYMSCKASGLA